MLLTVAKKFMSQLHLIFLLLFHMSTVLKLEKEIEVHVVQIAQNNIIVFFA